MSFVDTAAARAAGEEPGASPSEVELQEPETQVDLPEYSARAEPNPTPEYSAAPGDAPTAKDFTITAKTLKDCPGVLILLPKSCCAADRVKICMLYAEGSHNDTSTPWATCPSELRDPKYPITPSSTVAELIAHVQTLPGIQPIQALFKAKRRPNYGDEKLNESQTLADAGLVNSNTHLYADSSSTAKLGRPEYMAYVGLFIWLACTVGWGALCMSLCDTQLDDDCTAAAAGSAAGCAIVGVASTYLISRCFEAEHLFQEDEPSRVHVGGVNSWLVVESWVRLWMPCRSRAAVAQGSILVSNRPTHCAGIEP